MKNKLLKDIFRIYPFSKGRYRLMKLFESWLSKGEIRSTLPFGNYFFQLNVGEKSLQSSFYYFMPEAYESKTQQCIGEITKPGMTVFDIGAHLGLLTLRFAYNVGSDGKVYSFEPENSNFNRLKTNIDINNLDWVKPENMAISNKNGSQVLVLANADSDHSILNNSPTSGEENQQTIKTITLDDYIDQNNIKKVDVVKIDAEKSEHLVLEGGTKLFSSEDAPKIICELHSSKKFVNSGGDPARKRLYDLGYKSYIINTQLSKRKYMSELLPNEPITGLQNLLFTK